MGQGAGCRQVGVGGPSTISRTHLQIWHTLS